MNVTRHVTEFWFRATNELLATENSFMLENMDVPREVVRLLQKARMQRARAAVGVGYESFDVACDFAATTAAVNPGRQVAVVRFILTRPDGNQHTQYAVYPDGEVPLPPPYVSVEKLTEYHVCNG